MKKKRRKKYDLVTVCILLVISLIYYYYGDNIKKYYYNFVSTYTGYNQIVSYNIDEIPEYFGEPYIVINNNEPYFNDNDYSISSYELYSNLDYLGRAGVAIANIGVDLMPTSERGEIGAIKPTGWHTVKYDNIPGKYLYNRCHLIGYQLTGENANEKNLITCTRSMNNEGMLGFENKVTNYIKKTGNNVLYRVTPIYKDLNLLASGVLMEACSVYDNCSDIKFNVFVYNVQEGIDIDYASGDSSLKLANAN